MSGIPVPSPSPLPLPAPIPSPNESGSYNQSLVGEDGMIHDRDIFAPNTVQFDYDSSVVRSAEIIKLDEIITVMMNEASYKLVVEGHCDSRGTEEYNRSLGERRANSIRDHLITAGVSPDRIRTITYGEDKPKDYGQDEAAWATNRRGEFVLLRRP